MNPSVMIELRSTGPKNPDFFSARAIGNLLEPFGNLTIRIGPRVDMINIRHPLSVLGLKTLNDAEVRNSA